MLYKRLVIKLGTNLLTGGGDSVDLTVVSNLVDQIAFLHGKKHEIVVVTSGAVGLGRQKLHPSKERKDIPFKQVLASVGQNLLINMYDQLFGKYSITIAQALLTKNDLCNRAGYLNARNTLLALMDMRIICIVNENDVVATDEIGGIRFGDNDNLSAMVANLIDADLLVLLTDIEGLYTSNPRTDSGAELIPKIEKIDSRIVRLAGKGVAGAKGVGGMVTKVQAAKAATSCGIPAVIASGFVPDCLKKIVVGESTGTFFAGTNNRLESKKRWMLSGLASKGKIMVDDGAVAALKQHHRSLLPAGITGLEGKFQRGDVIDIIQADGVTIGSGITNYSSSALGAIKGAHSEEVARILGYEYGTEVVHRNNMVLM